MKLSAAAAIALTSFLFGCAGQAPSIPADPPERLPGSLMSSLEIPGNFLVRQRISVSTPQYNGDFEAVVQKHCGELIIIGLSPVGLKLFSIRQSDLRVDIQTLQPGDLSFAAERILLDVHRVYFYPVAEPPLEDGMHDLKFGTEELRERWSKGRLITRSIRMKGEKEEQWLEIRYGEAMGTSEKSDPRWEGREVSLQNSLYDYKLEIETLSHQALHCEGGP